MRLTIHFPWFTDQRMSSAKKLPRRSSLFYRRYQINIIFNDKCQAVITEVAEQHTYITAAFIDTSRFPPLVAFSIQKLHLIELSFIRNVNVPTYSFPRLHRAYTVYLYNYTRARVCTYTNTSQGKPKPFTGLLTASSH